MRSIVITDDSANHIIVQPFILEKEIVSISEYTYGINHDLIHQVNRTPETEEINRLKECYSCSDDPRLPDEIKQMPLGKREDFVDEFNRSFWMYNKENDEEYDVDKSEGVNRSNYAMRKAYEHCGMDHDFWSSKKYDIDPDEKDMEAGFFDDYMMEDSPDSLEEAEDKTDFPKKGENQKITLSNSNYPQFPFEYAAKLKKEYPSIWKRGGNIYGNTAYQNWKKFRDGQNTPGVQAWIKKREAWAARHFKNKRPAGVVALIKWGVVGQIGVSGMKKVLKPLIEKEKTKNREDISTDELEESMQQDNVKRIRETYIGGVPLETFKEAQGGYTNDITVIERGWSMNGNYYGETALREIAEQANNFVVGYFNHGETFNRDPRDWAIVTESGRVESGKVTSRIHIFTNPDGAFLEERIAYAKRKKANHLFGVSIDAFAQVTEGEAEGRDGVIVEKILKLNSVDIVMVPAAKGNFNAVESQSKSSESTLTGESVMDVKTLREEHPDTAAILIEEGRKEAASDHEKAQSELKEQVDAVSKQLAEVEENLAKASSKVDEYEQAEKQALFEADVRTLIEESLDDSKRSERFESILIGLGQENLETIKEMIADRQESVVNAVVTGEGTESPVVEAVEEAVEEADETTAPSDADRLAAFKANL